MDRTDTRQDSNEPPTPAADSETEAIIGLIALGEQQFAAGQGDAAIVTFQQVIERAPDCARAYNNLAVIHWERKQQIQALGHIQRAWSVHPTDPTTVMNYAEMLLAVGKAAQARRIYREYLHHCPDDQPAREALTRIEKDKDGNVAATAAGEPAVPKTGQPQNGTGPSTDSLHAGLINFLKQDITHIAVKQRVLRIVRQLQPDHYTNKCVALYSVTAEDDTSWFDSVSVLNWYAHHFKPVTYLEVGVRRGRSMAQVLVESDRTKAYGFDLWIPNYASVPEKGIVTTNPGAEFVLSELSGLGVRNPPRFFSGDSQCTLPAFWGQALAGTREIELLYIDGDHSYEGAKRDLRLAFQHLAPGGALVFDDTMNTAHLYLAGLWDEFKRLYPECIFIEDRTGAGTAVAFKPPFHRLYALMERAALSPIGEADMSSPHAAAGAMPPALIDPASVIDDVGRVFHWRQGVYRGIAPAAAASILKLLDDPALDELTEAGLVRTHIAAISTPEYPLVLVHEKIPFRTYCMEWTACMLHDAARMMCNLSIVLARNGLCLKEAHPWNVFFDCTRPVFIDFGSVVPLSAFRAGWLGEFYRYFIAPLALFSAGEHEMARRLLILKADDSLDGIEDRGILRPVLEHYRQLLAGAERHGILWLMYRIGDLLDSLQIPQHQGEWSNYDQRPASSPEEFAPKQRTTYELLKRLPRGGLLDMGANRGWYSKLACTLGYSVASFDVDDTSVTALYREARDERLPVHPFMLDFCNPTPPHGRIGLAYPAADERLCCDTALALALVHHLVFKSRLSFAEIARGIACFARQRVIVEFIPADDVHVKEWMTPAFDWYTLENFIAAMSVYFPRHTRFESSPSPRSILLFEGR